MPEILNRWTAAVLYKADCFDLRSAVIAAVAAGADLRDADLGRADLGRANLGGANLRGANLGRANLYGADLRGADLRDADLGGANLGGADLRSANLYGADLRGADLRGAVLSGANLRDANLGGANLSSADLYGADLGGANLGGANLGRANLGGANLGGANLRGADLRGANLTPVRDDFWAVLCSAPSEVPALRAALIDGKVDGSTYTGECACLVGTIANARHCAHDQIPGLTPNSYRPAERFFLGIGKGDTPKTSQFAKLAVEWIDDWTGRMEVAFAPARKAS